MLETELGDVLFWTGMTDVACRRADALAERAAASGDRVGALCFEILGAIGRLLGGSEEAAKTLGELAAEALPMFETAGDDMALYLGHTAVAEKAVAEGHFDDGLNAAERAFRHAAHAGYSPSSMLATLAWLRFSGTTPVSELLEWLDELPPGSELNQFVRAYRAWSLARIGRFDESRAILTQARAEQAERGGGVLLANLTAFESVNVELLAGDAERAAVFGAEGCRMHQELGGQAFLAGAAGDLAQALYALERLDEAERWTDRAAELNAAGHVFDRPTWRSVRAKLLARRGEHTEAERLAREAVEIADGTDVLDMQGDAYADLAEVLLLAGGRDDAVAALEQALERYERKENLVMAERARTRLAELDAESTSAESRKG